MMSLHSLVEKLVALKSHHFISKVQSQHFKELKESLKDCECLQSYGCKSHWEFFRKLTTIYCSRRNTKFPFDKHSGNMHLFVFYFTR